MFLHHTETIDRTRDYFARQPHVTGLLLGGSIAHGFASPESDVDVLIVVDGDDFAERLRTGRTCFFSRDWCAPPTAYVDGKYISEGLLREVAAHGSEPARFQYQDATVLFDTTGHLEPLVRAAARYPREHKADRIRRFQAQFEAWQWYASEALNKHNAYLLNLAVAKLTLFGGRLVLAHNEILYPYHKWFLRVLERAPDKPADLLERIEHLARSPGQDTIERFARTIRDFRDWEITHETWPALFMQDSELNWRSGSPPIDDI